MLCASPSLQSPDGYLEQRRKTLELVRNRLISAQTQWVNRRKQHYVALTAKLDAMSPLKVLTRGYAMAQDESGEVIRSVRQVQSGAQIRVSVSDGQITAAVSEVKENGI